MPVCMHTYMYFVVLLYYDIIQKASLCITCEPCHQ